MIRIELIGALIALLAVTACDPVPPEGHWEVSEISGRKIPNGRPTLNFTVDDAGQSIISGCAAGGYRAADNSLVAEFVVADLTAANGSCPQTDITAGTAFREFLKSCRLGGDCPYDIHGDRLDLRSPSGQRFRLLRRK